MSDELAGRNRNYYKSGRGIPSPVLVKRFYGQADADVLAKEILMLTKMNWNSGDTPLMRICRCSLMLKR